MPFFESCQEDGSIKDEVWFGIVVVISFREKEWSIWVFGRVVGRPLAPRIVFWVCGIVACVCGNTLELHPSDERSVWVR